MKEKLIGNPIPIGTFVVYFNQWTDFENYEIRDSFREMSFEEVQALTENDILWDDIEPHPNGKVYGFLKLRVTKVEHLENDGVRIHFKDSFDTIYPEGRIRKFVHEDENKLIDLISANPLATEVFTGQQKVTGKAMGIF